MRVNWPWVKPKDNYFALISFIAISQAIGVSGTIFTIPSIPTWYESLTKPTFSPPNWLFGPVWTVLYTLIGLAAYMVWRKYQFRSKSLSFWYNFAIQLALNFLWTPLFFGLHWVAVAAAEILVLWYFIYQSIRTGHKLVPAAGYLLIPYLAWITFASLLNISILILN